MIKYNWFKSRLDTIFAPAIKIWSNGIALKLDTYQSCFNACLYCSTRALREMTLSRNGISPNHRVARIVNFNSLINSFNRALRGDDKQTPFMNWAIRNKYFIELGTTGETFQDADNDLKLSYSFLKMTSALKIPIFVNTKLNLICRDERYKELLINYEAPIFIQASFVTTDDKLGKLYDPLAPLPSERLKTLRELNQYEHVATFAYISPFIAGVTDIDIDKFMNDILDAGIKGAHLRDFYLQGKTFQNSFWEKYKEENKNSLESFPGGHHIRYEKKLEFIEYASEIAQKRDKKFKIVGMKTRFFDMNINYGKGLFDILNDDFKNGIVDFTIIPILRKIKENGNKPQLLFWSKLGYKENKIKYPEYIRTNEGDINNLVDWGCNCNKSEVELRIDGYNWIKAGLWNGFGDTPSGFIREIEGIYPVKSLSGKYLEEDGDYVYAYIPEKYNYLLKSESKQMFLVEPDLNDLKNPYVSEKDIKEFLIPKRLGGTEDKWMKF